MVSIKEKIENINVIHTITKIVLLVLQKMKIKPFKTVNSFIVWKEKKIK